MASFEDLGIKTKLGRARYATTCPQCDNTRTKHKGALCLTVNNEEGNRWFHCNHCGWSGNLDAMGKYDQVQKESKMPTQERAYTKVVAEYIQSRGLSLNTAKSYRLYEVTANKRTLIGFPIFMSLTLVNVKFLNLDFKPGEKMTKWFQLSQDIGTRTLPFGLNTLKHNEDGSIEEVILTEGEIDAMSWYESGFINCISVPQGAPSPEAKEFTKEFAWLQDPYVKSVFSRVKRFILSTDDDKAGRLLRDHLSMILGKERCRFVQYPSGYKDANEVLNGDAKKTLTALGKEGIKGLHNNLASIPVRGVIRPSDVREELDRLREHGFTPGIGVGVKEIDYLYTAKAPHIQFVTGVPGAGKSTYQRWWCVELVRNNPDLEIKWAWFSPENRPVSREHAKIAECLTGLSIKKGQHNSMSDDLYRKTMRFIEKHFLIISPDRMNYENWGDEKKNKANTMPNLLMYLEYLKKTENVFGYVIDAWNKIEHEQPKYMTDTNFISQQLDYLIDFNAYWMLHGIVIVHPRKIELQGNNYKMPSLYDIKGSSAWKEKADIGVIAHRYKMRKKANHEMKGNEDEDEKWEVVRDAPTIIRTEKIRFEEVGVEDRVRLKMIPGGRFVVDKDNKTAYKDPVEAPKMAPHWTEKPGDDEELPF